jgi:hypothetical protein
MPEVAYSYGKVDPVKVILPIFSRSKSGIPEEFLGTGFVVGSKRQVATAYHVVSEWFDHLGTMFLPQTTLYPLTLINFDRDIDLAILDMTPYEPHDWFTLAKDEEIYQNQFVICSEYSQTSKIGGIIDVSMATRIGNIVRRINSDDHFGKAGEDALEISFPALRGSSGAPILSSKDLKVWGVIIANKAYHLIPAQIEKTYDNEGKLIDEVHYMLPQAIAVHVKHLRKLME